MPAANFPEYARSLQDDLDKVVATGEIVVTTLQVDQRSAVRGFIAGSLQFYEGSVFSGFTNLSSLREL